jgi:acetyl-CoA C-acetyltransferase
VVESQELRRHSSGARPLTLRSGVVNRGAMREVVILSARRTPIGSFLGGLAPVSATELGAVAAKAALADAEVKPEQVGEAYVGAVLLANLGQAPARQVALGAGLLPSTPSTTVNKVCGSGLKAVMLASQSIQLGDAQVVLAGGIESMSNAPYYLDRARQGYRLGHQTTIDGIIRDGLWDVYNNFHMGNAAELCAREYGISREAQDAHARMSYERALEAQAAGSFSREIVPVEIRGRKGKVDRVEQDEEPGRGRPEAFGSLKPAFDSNGTVTAGNASSLNDGAAMLVLADAEWAKAQGLKAMARIVGSSSAAREPEWFTVAPALAIEKVLNKLGLTVHDLDLMEINEAFSVVSLANEQLLSLDRSRVNVCGGAVALGHPIGASGARILVTLLHAMAAREADRGLASLCIGGGEAVAMVVERLPA